MRRFRTLTNVSVITIITDMMWWNRFYKSRQRAFLMFLILVLLVACIFFAWKYYSSNESETQPGEVLEKTSKLIFLPEGEEPTVARIQDKEKLKGQSFFDQAENGDYLLVYEKSKMALIYRESVNKLVTVGPITTEVEQVKKE